MHERFIVSSIGMYGYWGAGNTIEEALKNMRKAGGKARKGYKTCKVWRFTSDLPFAPASKLKADDNEADCWIGKDGSISWIRCEREEVQ